MSGFDRPTFLKGGKFPYALTKNLESIQNFGVLKENVSARTKIRTTFE